VRVRLTHRGRTNYTTVRREWGAAVYGAAGGDTTNIDAALALLTSIKNGLTTMRPTARLIDRRSQTARAEPRL
jgi:hypothetical protein